MCDVMYSHFYRYLKALPWDVAKKKKKKYLSGYESRVMVQVVCEQIIGKVSRVSVGA